MENSLSSHRKNASDQSLGSSHQSIYQKAIELISKFAGSGQHLDFGSGKGELIRQIHSKIPQLRLTGIDLMERPANIPAGIQWVGADLNQDFKLQTNEFDSISAIEIIEHLENPRQVFRQLYQHLRKGGVLILSTPNNESWRSIVSYMMRGHFVAFTDSSYPAHITPLNRQDLMRSAQEAGFEFIQWDYIEKGCIPGLTSMSWQTVSFGVLQGLRYSDNLFIVLRRPSK